MKTHDLWNVTFFNQIIDTMADGLFTLNADGEIISWNQAMEKISGYTAGEAIGKGCALIDCSRCLGKQCPSNVQACGVLQKGRAEAKECSIRHKDGHDVPVIKSARVVKDTDGTILGVVETITDMSELHRIRRQAEEAERRLGEVHRVGNIIGRSPAMQQVFEAIRAASESRATVLIQGESGTGKELVAGAIHYLGTKSQHPMVTVNCSALSETLLESELFGHVKGSFTGAHRDRIGRFEEADGGTIFLDEIGELTPYMQVKLLRVIQEREIERVGESKKRRIDIRIIAATHQDLYEITMQGKFREDLFYRLKVFPISVPPLRERRVDIPLLVRHFIDKGNRVEGKEIQGVDPEVMNRLMDYPWPGNVRELENAIEHAFVICRTPLISLKDLPLEIRENTRILSGIQKARLEPGKETGIAAPVVLTRESLLTLLEACGWNKAEVARRIGKSRTSVWKYMRKWDIPLDEH